MLFNVTLFLYEHFLRNNEIEHRKQLEVSNTKRILRMNICLRSLWLIACLYISLITVEVSAFLPSSSPSSSSTVILSNFHTRFVKGTNIIRSATTTSDAAKVDEEDDSDLSTSMKAMKKFAEKYCEITGTYFCSDPTVAAAVIKGLAKHKDEINAPLCPCRHYEDKEAEVKLAYWNCPCVPMRERKECHCMLFLNPDNPFVGDQQKIAPKYLRTMEV